MKTETYNPQPIDTTGVELPEELKQLAELISGNIIGTTKEVLTSEEAAKLLKISRRTLYHWRKAGVLKYSQIGRKVFFRNKDVQALIERNTLNRYQLK